MPVTTKQQVQHADSQIDEGFAKQLESMLGGIATTRKPVEKQVVQGSVSIDEVMQQANDGISLAQIVDMTLQQAGDLLAQLYYQIEAAGKDATTNYVELNNAIREQMAALDDLFAGVTFQQQPIFQQPGARQFPTGINLDEKLTLQIPNTSLNKLGAKSWQTVDGPVLPTHQQNQLSYRFSNLCLEEGQRVRLMVGEADVLQECLHDLHSTMQTVADLINQVELDWLNNAIVEHGTLSITAIGVEQSQLTIEAPAVAVDDSLAALQVKSQEQTQAAMQVIIGAINMLADYRDVAVSVASELHQAMNNLMAMPRSEELNSPLAVAMVKDVQKMFEQQPAQSILAQSNIED